MAKPKKTATRAAGRGPDTPGASAISDSERMQLIRSARAGLDQVWMQHGAASSEEPKGTPGWKPRVEVRPRSTKHGPRPRMGKNEWAQHALLVLRPPEHTPDKELHRMVSEWLEKSAEYRATGIGEISLQTIQRAWKTIRSQKNFVI